MNEIVQRNGIELILHFLTRMDSLLTVENDSKCLYISINGIIRYSSQCYIVLINLAKPSEDGDKMANEKKNHIKMKKKTTENHLFPVSSVYIRQSGKCLFFFLTFSLLFLLSLRYVCFRRHANNVKIIYKMCFFLFIFLCCSMI